MWWWEHSLVWAEGSHYHGAKPLTSALLPAPGSLPSTLLLWEKCEKWFNFPQACYDSNDQKQGPLTALVFNSYIHLHIEWSLSLWLMAPQHIPLTKIWSLWFFPPCDWQHKHVVKSMEQMVRHLGKFATFKEVTGLQQALKPPWPVIERRLSFNSRVKWSETQSLHPSRNSNSAFSWWFLKGSHPLIWN